MFSAGNLTKLLHVHGLEALKGFASSETDDVLKKNIQGILHMFEHDRKKEVEYAAPHSFFPCS